MLPLNRESPPESERPERALGSGSTLMAAERAGRVCCGVELDPAYVDLVLRRYVEVTGGSATLQSTGESLAELRARRAQEEPAQTAAPQV